MRRFGAKSLGFFAKKMVREALDFGAFNQFAALV